MKFVPTTAKRTGDDMAVIEQMFSVFVVLPLPTNYGFIMYTYTSQDDKMPTCTSSHFAIIHDIGP